MNRKALISISILLIVWTALGSTWLAKAQPDVLLNHAAYTEAPMLSARVHAGLLPPVAERLPDQPFIVGPGVYLSPGDLPDWTPGKYGGTLRSAHSVTNWAPDIFVALNEPFLMAPKISDQGIVCSVCQSYQVSPDNKIFTFSLRQGLKWSDGQPVTTEDVRFAWEDIRNNPLLSPNGPNNLFRTGFSPLGSLAQFQIIDAYTFRVTFDGSYGAFLRGLAIEGWVGYTIILEPAHYLKQFHIKYTTLEALKPLLDKMGLTDEWWQVFQFKRCQNWDMSNPRCAGYPALTPWLPVETGNNSLMRWERNPYYFKVDTTGQQLPYINYLASEQVNTVEMITIKITNGEVDFQREGTVLPLLPLYDANDEEGGYRVALLDLHVDPTSLRINQTYANANWRAVSRDIRFRRAVSLAINRQELIDALYYGYGTLPLKTMGPMYSQFNVAQANTLLDAMGLTEKDAEGYRKYPDGSVIEIVLKHGATSPDFSPVSDLVSQYLKTVGLKVIIEQTDNWQIEWAANQIQAMVMWSHDIGWGNDVSSGSVDRAGPLWQDWYNTAGSEGEEPPAWAKEAVTVDSLKWAAIPGSVEYNQKVEDGFTWCQTNLPYINLLENAQHPLIVSKNLRNVPVNGYGIAANFSIVQMWMDLKPMYLPTIRR